MQGIGMLIKPHYIKDYTVQNHPVQGPTVYTNIWNFIFCQKNNETLCQNMTNYQILTKNDEFSNFDKFYYINILLHKHSTA